MAENKWERTNVTNALRNRQSGRYYACVKVNGKQKWRTLEAPVFPLTKLLGPLRPRHHRSALPNLGTGRASSGTGFVAPILLSFGTS